jgi:phosphatidylinositol-4,5-bisphosphate 3-kinase
VDSPLSLFLLQRAFEEPKYLGLKLFWALRSLSHLPWMRQRVLELTYLFCAFSQPHDRRRYLESLKFTRAQIDLWYEFHPPSGPPPTETLEEVIAQRVKIGEGFHLPVDPKILVSSYVPEKCKFMDSKKKPLWAVYRRAGNWEYVGRPSTISLILKIGDDITQDQLTLQLLRVMDTIWKNHGLDLRMSLYEALPTGDKEGYIEVVPEATTLTGMQKDFGGPGSSHYVLKWLKAQNMGHVSPPVLETYYLSLAGYCVATYVLGIGDRHCSNMMMQGDGHFFHIDFGHFLGHFKTKKIAGVSVKRENEMFYYSEALEEVLTHYKSLKRFQEVCFMAFKHLRENSSLLIYLLLSMLGTGIEELQTRDDVKFVEKTLMLGKDDKYVQQQWIDMLKKTKGSWRQAANDRIHGSVH